MDECDRAQMREESVRDGAVEDAMHKARQIPKGEPGECDFCGEWSGRLVNGACAPCRDKRGLV